MFIKSKQSSKKRYLGQGMTEYIIIVAVIAIAAIGAFGYFGQIVEQQITGVGSELGGNDTAAGNARDNASALAEQAVEDVSQNANEMGNYVENSSQAAAGLSN